MQGRPGHGGGGGGGGGGRGRGRGRRGHVGGSDSDGSTSDYNSSGGSESVREALGAGGGRGQERWRILIFLLFSSVVRQVTYFSFVFRQEERRGGGGGVTCTHVEQEMRQNESNKSNPSIKKGRMTTPLCNTPSLFIDNKKTRDCNQLVFDKPLVYLCKTKNQEQHFLVVFSAVYYDIRSI